MRAPFLLAAVLAVGVNAAVVRRADDTTTVATTAETFTTDVTETPTETIITTTEVPATTTDAESATETSAATVTETGVVVPQEVNPAVDFWTSMLSNCANSTSLPHSDVCVSQWWHSSGCIAPVPADKQMGWAEMEDVDKIKSEMAKYYEDATAKDATEAAKNSCKPLPTAVTTAIKCMNAVSTDICKDCFESTTIFGMEITEVNSTCVDSCMRAEENQAQLTEVCPNAASLMQCKDKLAEKCGNCTSETDALMMGMPLMDVDDDCFEECYQENKDEIRASCPLPKPLEQAVECHKTLAKICDDCVDDDHNIDRKCLDGCVQEHAADLANTCPEEVLSGVLTIGEIMPNEEEFMQIVAGLMAQIQLPAFDFSELLGGIFENGDFDDILQGLLGANSTTAATASGNNDHDHDHDDDEHDDDEHDEDDNDDVDFQSVISNVLGALGVNAPVPATTADATTAAAATETVSA